MVTVCQKCGDRGFPETLNYCVKCGETAEHTYCLDKLPNFLNEGVPWTCEDCTIRVEGESAPDNPSPASVVNSKCMDMRSQQAQCSRRRKRKRGKFYLNCKICGTSDGLEAHLSNKAHLSASKLAAQLPEVLHLDLVHKSDVWPECFYLSSPTDEHIAVYFFSKNESYQRSLDSLVETLMCQGQSMRTLVDSIEVLIFSSIELPLQLWRIQGKHYLWAVFKESHHKDSHNNIQSSRRNIVIGKEKSGTKIFDIQCPFHTISNKCPGNKEKEKAPSSDNFKIKWNLGPGCK
ncbi:RING/FYVE/PHD zinc finger superfamily protein [Quillaja saponaria]|uniref:RING/FYVE/PHD zinc finger superfamily protein n=1 Tax=Quillaja saponaria TaxID=32244 RepID=A0AAD7Q3G7_QUISA|nr:RING/FYVE/PHD zinc finger superfamily protein [Quillaja saponaria]